MASHDCDSDAALDKQAQEMAEAALAGLPEGVRATKLPAVKEGILKRLRTSRPTAALPPAQPLGGRAPGQSSGKLAVGSSMPPKPAKVSKPPPPPWEQPLEHISLETHRLDKVGSAEACGDEPWFADAVLRRQLLEATAAKHAEQKILVGVPADEIRRIHPGGGRVLGAGAVLRLGGSHHGGYGEADIKYAYRQLSRALHPDKNPSVPEAPDAFKRLSDAAEELKRGLEDARRMLERISGMFSAVVTPEMLERPQGPLFAEASRLLSAVLSLTGEGMIPDAVRGKAPEAFGSSPIYKGCSPKRLLSKWDESDELLDLFAEGPIRIAYDCAPRRFRAQFLCLLARLAEAEAIRNDSCVRASLQTVLSQFPEVGLWRDLLDKLRRRTLLKGDDEIVPKEAASAPAGSWDDASMSDWAREWRHVIAQVLPKARNGAASATYRELRLLAAALWKDVADWAADEAGGQRQLALFAAEALSAESGLAWAYIPATDLLLIVGEGMVGIMANGAFTKVGPPGGYRRSFSAALRLVKRGSQKRGLAAGCESEAKVAKLNRGPTRVVMLTNLVGAGEVDEDIEEETSEECAKYGKLVKCVVRECKGAPDKEAVRIFLEFEKVEAASKAYKDMNGRYFGGKVVKARFYDEEKYEKGELERRVPTPILLLSNLVDTEDVDDDLEAETAAEASQFGAVKRCAVRLNLDAPDSEAVRVFVEFERSEDAAKALSAVNGRSFGGREIKARFFEEAIPCV